MLLVLSRKKFWKWRRDRFFEIFWNEEKKTLFFSFCKDENSSKTCFFHLCLGQSDHEQTKLRKNFKNPKNRSLLHFQNFFLERTSSMIQFWYWGWNRQHPCFQTHQQLYQYYTHNRLDLLPKWLHESKIPKSEKVNFSIFMVSPIESSVQRESSSHPYYQIFFGRIPWSIPFLTHFRPHSCDTYTGLYPLSNLRVKSQIFKLRLFDIFKKHIRLKKNSATTKLFLIFVIILSTTTF